jgi:TolA-binding protein
MTEPIEGAHFSERFLDWFELNQKRVYVAFIALLVIGGGLLGWRFLAERSNHAALLMEYEASKSIQDAHLYREADEKAAQEAYRKGISLYQDLISQYPRSRSAAFAQYEIGNSYAAMREYDNAITAYQGFIDRYPSDHELLPLVYQRLGYTFLQTGKIPEAEKVFEQVVQLSGAKNRDQSIFELGQIYEKLDKKEIALSRYQEITKEFPTSPIASEARARIKSLGGEPALLLSNPEGTLQNTPQGGEKSEAQSPPPVSPPQ